MFAGSTEADALLCVLALLITEPWQASSAKGRDKSGATGCCPIGKCTFIPLGVKVKMVFPMLLMVRDPDIVYKKRPGKYCLPRRPSL